MVDRELSKNYCLINGYALVALFGFFITPCKFKTACVGRKAIICQFYITLSESVIKCKISRTKIIICCIHKLLTCLLDRSLNRDICKT